MPPLQPSVFNLPRQDLEQCSLFTAEPQAVSAWVDQLPMGTPHRAGGQLRSALAELNRVELVPQLRCKLLDILRGAIDSVVDAITRDCLNQPIVLDEDAQLQADLISDLCSFAADGYTLVAVHTIQHSDRVTGVNPARLACEALHRAVIYLGQRILHAYLLYQPVEVNSWARLHQLYGLAERQQLARLPMDDSTGRQSSIGEEYLAPLLLACSKPNQLRQHDIAGAYRAFREWRDLVKLQDPEIGRGLFAIDMDSDQPPVYAELLVRRGTQQFRYINTDALISHLENLKHSRGTQGLSVIEFDRHTRLDTNLLEHLIRSLGEVSQRNFARRDARSTLHIACGLSNVHYYLAGELNLLEVIHGAGYQPKPDELPFNPFLARQPRGDQWQQANPEEDTEEHSPDPEAAMPVDVDRLTEEAQRQDQQAQTPVQHVVYSVMTTNTSPGGYCVEWPEPPAGIHIGDVVCIRETEQPNEQWAVAVIRWISQVKHAPTLLGLELMSPQGSALAAQIKMANGEMSRPIRVLLLPEISLVGQSNTLIVPRMVFREGQRIRLIRENESSLVKLRRQVASTGYFSQMDFEYIRSLDEEADHGMKERLPTSSFDSIWTEI